MTEPSLDPGTAGTDAVPGRPATTGTSRWYKLVAIGGLVALLWVGSEMYEVLYGEIGGGGPGGGHGPGQDTPVENQDQEIDTDDEDDQDPSQGGHG
jgi:hypothetical protein